MSDKTTDGANGSDTPQEETQKVENPAEDQVQKMSEEIDKLKQDYLYLRAEFDTYRRNAVKERSDLLKYGSERLAQDLLNVLDNFERALETEVSSDNLGSYVQGVQLTAKELESTLAKHGISELESKGQAFDPSIHEALTSEETDEVPAGHVYRVFKKAYKMHDKVLRPAQVVVAKEKS